MSAARGWALALTASFAFYGLAGLCLWLALNQPGAARVVALLLGGAVYSLLLAVWAYAAGNRAGLNQQRAVVALLRRGLATAYAREDAAVEQAQAATAEARASWERWEEEIRRG